MCLIKMEISAELKYKTAFLTGATFVHALGTVHFTATVALFNKFIYLNAKNYYEKFGYGFKYYVCWANTFCALHYLFSLITDIVTWLNFQKETPPWMFYFRSCTRGCVILPMSFLVFVYHWIARYVSAEQLFGFPEEAYLPFWAYDVMACTNPMVFHVADLVSTKADYPSNVTFFLFLSLYLGGYVGWVHAIYVYTGTWAVPVLKKYSFTKKYIFIIVIIFMTFIAHLFGKFVNNLFWDDEVLAYVVHGRKPEKDSEMRTSSLRKILSASPSFTWRKNKAVKIQTKRQGAVLTESAMGQELYIPPWERSTSFTPSRK